MKDAGGSTDEVTIAEILQHKVDTHLAEAFDEVLFRHPSEKSRSQVTTQAFRSTFDANCDFELDLFRGNHELRDFIYGLVRQSQPERLSPELSESIYEACHPLWRRHRARIRELEEAKNRNIERLRFERAERQRIADLENQQAERVREELANQAAESMARRRAFLAQAERLFYEDYLAFEQLIVPDDQEELGPEIESLRYRGVAKWLKDYAPAIQLEQEQLEAISTVQGNTLVTARAGSGKTSVLVFRALFMLTHCRIPAEQILLVAFNRAAAHEIRQRLNGYLEKVPHSNVSLPEIRTFHSIAYRLNEGNRNRLSLPPINEYLKDDDDQDGAKSRVIREVLKTHLSVEDNRKQMQRLMLRHFETDWLSIIRPQSVVEYLERVNWDSVARQAMDGTYVKSRGERVISDTLFRYGVEYRYEKAIQITDLQNVRPDFTVTSPTEDPIVIEYFGMVGDAKYEADKRKKLDAYRAAGIQVLELFPSDLTTPDLIVQKVITFLTSSLGPESNLRPLPDEALEQKLKSQSKTRFERLIKTFIERSRVEGLGPSDIETYLSRTATKNILDQIEHDFYAMAGPLYQEYLDYLTAEDLEDFEGLIFEAVNALEAGHARYSGDDDREVNLREIRFISIDEFQDFSVSFQKLIDEILALTGADVFAVGDDWQSINSYMGAIPNIFQTFAEQRTQLKSIVIPVNQRSTRNIVEFGNAVMASTSSELQARAREGIDGKPVRFVDITLIKHNSSEGENQLWQLAKNRGVALLRICEVAAREGFSVAVLSRLRGNPTDVNEYAIPNKLEPKLKYLSRQISKYSSFPSDTEPLAESSTHGFKGKERDVVVVWDSDISRYPFINPDWIFSRIFGVSLTGLLQEEQRLAYVAVTRARRGLILLAEGKPSPVFSGLMIAYQPPSNLITEAISAGELQIRVQGGYESKVELKKAGFRWAPSERAWVKIKDSTHSLEKEARAIQEQKPEWFLRALACGYKVSLETTGVTMDITHQDSA